MKFEKDIMVHLTAGTLAQKKRHQAKMEMFAKLIDKF